MKKIVIGITGSIAIYKTCDLISILNKKGYDIEIIMTESATKFISPLTFGSLIHKPVLVDDFDETGYQIKHINIVKDADCMIIVPATANVIAKIAHGIGDDALTSAFLAATCPKLIAPAMNVHMYENIATQTNLKTCQTYGIDIIEPSVGHLACGYNGKGHLADIEDIVEIIDYTVSDHPLKGKHVLITAGPTQEAIDPVRYITNHSSGKMGYSLARVARNLGAHVTLITGPTSIKKPTRVDVINIVSAQNMFDETLDRYSSQDYVIMSAAVGDFKPATYNINKTKKSDASFQLGLVKNPDILQHLGYSKQQQTICGFAMETENVLENAKAKFLKKNCDLLVVNDLFEEGAGFKKDTNKVTFITREKNESIELMTKEELAYKILNKLIEIKGENKC